MCVCSGSVEFCYAVRFKVKSFCSTVETVLSYQYPMQIWKAVSEHRSQHRMRFPQFQRGVKCRHVAWWLRFDKCYCAVHFLGVFAGFNRMSLEDAELERQRPGRLLLTSFPFEKCRFWGKTTGGLMFRWMKGKWIQMMMLHILIVFLFMSLSCCRPSSLGILVAGSSPYAH